MPSILQLIISFVQLNPAAINMAVPVLEAFLAHIRLGLAKHEEALKVAAHAAQTMPPSP